MLLRFAAWAFSFLILGAAHAQDYPTKPIRILTGPAGGGNDIITRLVARGMSGSFDKPTIVDNRAANITAEIVARAAPDGYTMLQSGSVWLTPLMRKVTYDAVKDFSPITLVTTSPLMVVVHPSLAANSVKELIALAKAKPGVLNYSSGPSGTIPHLAGELFKFMAGLNIVRISYDGTGPGLNALIANQTQLAFPSVAGAVPHVKSGRLRGLAVTSAQQSKLAPDLPTVAAAGLADYEAANILALFVPAKTPTPIIKRLNQEIVRVLNTPDVKEKIFNAGTEVVGSSPQELALAVKTEIVRMGKVIKDAGIREE